MAVALVASSLVDVLSRFNVVTLENSYIRRRHPILAHALAHSRIVASGCLHNGSGGDVDINKALSAAVEALGLVVQAQDVNGPVTSAALQALAEVMQVLRVASTDGLVSRSLQSFLVRAAVQAVVCTRFELAATTENENVLCGILDALRGAADAATDDAVGARSLGWIFSTALYLAIDASSSGSGALRNSAAALSTHALLRLCSVACRFDDATKDVLTGVHAPLISSLHQLCTLLDMPTEPQTYHAASSRPLKGAVDDADCLAFHRAVPLYTFASAVCPLPVTEDIAAHNALISPARSVSIHVPGGTAKGMMAPDTVRFPSSVPSDAAADMRGVAPFRLPQLESLPSPTRASSPMSATDPAPQRVTPRLRAVVSSAPLLALNLLAQAAEALIPPPRPSTSGGSSRAWLWQDDAWLALWRDRVALALVWLADGVGPLSGSELDSLSAVPVRRASSSSSASSAPTAISEGIIGMRVPRLPLFSAVLRVALRLFGSQEMRVTLAASIELFINRVCINAVSAPARLVQACAVLMGPAAIRTVLSALVDEQLARDKLLRNYASASSVYVDVDAIAGGSSASASPSSIWKAIASAASASASVPGSATVGVVDVETVRTLVDVLHSRSPMMLVAQAAIEALECFIVSTDFVTETLTWFDGRLDASDVMRVVIQTCAAAATGQAYVYVVHGHISAPQVHAMGREADDKILTLPYPRLLREHASRCLHRLLDVLREHGPNASAAACVLDTDVATLAAATRDSCTRKRILHACARTFNAKPRRGVEALKATGLLELAGRLPTVNLQGNAQGSLRSLQPSTSVDTGQVISVLSPSPHHSASAVHATATTAAAAVLRTYRASGGFHPAAIGEFLGSGEDAEDDAKRRSHVAAHVDDFSGSSLVTAMRIYLRTFRLPGEAQQIDRILNAFAASAHVACPEGALLPSIDATYLLCFSIIMLNTDLHSANIKPERRMSEDAFVRNNVYYGDDICHGRRISEDVLRSIYREIKTSPITPPLISLAGLPLQGPAVSGAPTKENVECAISFAGRGEPLTFLDYQDLIRLRIHNDRGTGALLPLNAAAAHVAALPEVWHACTRVGLSMFARCFDEPRVEAVMPTPGEGDDDGLSPSQKAAAGADSVTRQMAWEQLDVLVSCAQVAYQYGMHSGVGIVVAALCQIAGQTLRAIGETSECDAALTAFMSDSRAHMALTAALWLACQRGSALSSASWQCVLDCLFRLQHAGVIDLLAINKPLPSSDQGVDAPVSETDSDVALQHLLQAYSLSCVKMGRSRRQHRSTVAQSLAEAVVLEAQGSLPFSSTSSANTPADSSQGVAPLLGTPGDPHGTEIATEKVDSLRAESAEVPAPSRPGSSISALLSWLFGRESGDRGDAVPVMRSPEVVPAHGDAIADAESDALNSERVDCDWHVQKPLAAEMPPNLSKLVRAATELWGSITLLDTDATTRVVSALIKLSGFPCPLTIDASGSCRSSALRPKNADAENSCGSLSVGPSSALTDDGAAFVCTMESANYKCVQLPPPPEPGTGSPLSRLVLRGLGAVIQAAALRGSEPMAGLALDVARHISECATTETTAVTRRVRVALGIAAAPCVSLLLLPSSMGDPPMSVLEQALELLTTLCSFPGPAGGAARLLISWSLSSRLRPQSTPQLRRLRIFGAASGGATVCSGVAPELHSLRPWEAQRGAGPALSARHKLVAIVEACATSACEDGCSTAISGLDNEDIHALDLVTTTSARAALGSMSIWVADEVTDLAGLPCEQLDASTSCTACAMLDALAIFIHRPIATTAITVDDLSVDAIDALGLNLLSPICDSDGMSRAAASGLIVTDCFSTIIVHGLRLLALTIYDKRLGIRLHALHTLRQISLRLTSDISTAHLWRRVTGEVVVPLLDLSDCLWGELLASQSTVSAEREPCVHTLIASITSASEILAHASSALLTNPPSGVGPSCFVAGVAALRRVLANASSAVAVAVQPDVLACLHSSDSGLRLLGASAEPSFRSLEAQAREHSMHVRNLLSAAVPPSPGSAP